MIEPMLFYYRSFLTFQVRSVLQEMRELFEANEMEALKDNKAKAAMMLRHTALERNKRCLLAYLNYRVEKIRDMRWQFGAVLPSDVKVFDKIIDTLPGIDLPRPSLCIISQYLFSFIISGKSLRTRTSIFHEV